MTPTPPSRPTVAQTRSGHAAAAYNLGVLLAHRGETSEAVQAYRRARERGEGEVSDMAHAALDELNGHS